MIRKTLLWEFITLICNFGDHNARQRGSTYEGPIILFDALFRAVFSVVFAFLNRVQLTNMLK